MAKISEKEKKALKTSLSFDFFTMATASPDDSAAATAACEAEADAAPAALARLPKGSRGLPKGVHFQAQKGKYQARLS